MGKNVLELRLQKSKLEASIARAKAAKLDMDSKLIETELQVERLRNHQALQDQQIAKAESDLARVSEELQKHEG